MNASEKTKAVSLAERFLIELNCHGHSFQRTVMRTIVEQNIGWDAVPWEFPVQVSGRDSRIDFILARRREFPSDPRYLLICEAKRVNPALGDWCFAGAPDRHHAFSTGCYVETICRGRGTETQLHRLCEPEHVYEIGIELKTNREGDPVGGSGRGAIEEAASQVLRGMNGLIDFMQSEPETWEREQEIRLLPVIITTAQLWTTDADLANADLRSGNLPPDGFSIEPQEQIWLHYPQSPSLRPSSLPAEKARNLADALFHRFVRRIAVVSVEGIEGFLKAGMWRA
jgi:hypothetical protein